MEHYSDMKRMKKYQGWSRDYYIKWSKSDRVRKISQYQLYVEFWKMIQITYLQNKNRLTKKTNLWSSKMKGAGRER